MDEQLAGQANRLNAGQLAWHLTQIAAQPHDDPFVPAILNEAARRLREPAP